MGCDQVSSIKKPIRLSTLRVLMGSHLKVILKHMHRYVSNLEQHRNFNWEQSVEKYLSRKTIKHMIILSQNTT